MLRPILTVFAALGIVTMGVGLFHLQEAAAPRCSSEAVQHDLTEILRGEFQLSGIALNNAHAVEGGFFARRYDCSVQVAEMRGGVDASAMRWMRVLYTTASNTASGQSVVNIRIEGAVPLDPKRTTWQRLSSYFRP